MASCFSTLGVELRLGTRSGCGSCGRSAPVHLALLFLYNLADQSGFGSGTAASPMGVLLCPWVLDLGGGDVPKLWPVMLPSSCFKAVFSVSESAASACTYQDAKCDLWRSFHFTPVHLCRCCENKCASRSGHASGMADFMAEQDRAHTIAEERKREWWSLVQRMEMALLRKSSLVHRLDVAHLRRKKRNDESTDNGSGSSSAHSLREPIDNEDHRRSSKSESKTQTQGRGERPELTGHLMQQKQKATAERRTCSTRHFLREAGYSTAIVVFVLLVFASRCFHPTAPIPVLTNTCHEASSSNVAVAALR